MELTGTLDLAKSLLSKVGRRQFVIITANGSGLKMAQL